MKNYFFFIFMLIGFNCFAQINHYESDWAFIDSLEHFRRMDSAIVATTSLMEKCLQDKQNPVAKAHYIKAFIFKSKYEIEKELQRQDGLKENYCYQEVLERLSPKLIALSESTEDEVIQAMLYSNIADILLKYHSDLFTCGNLRRPLRYATISSYDPDYKAPPPRKNPYRDSVEAVIEELKQQTIKYLLLATKTEATKKIPAHYYSVLLEKTAYIDTTQFRFSLYDLLLDNAIWYLEKQVHYTTLHRNYEAYPFRDSLAFVRAEDFIKYDFASSDRQAMRFEAYRLYQKLLKAHLGSDRQNLLAKFDFQRMEFARNHGAQIINGIDGFYIDRLRAMEQRYIAVPFSTSIAYAIAQKIYKKASNDVRYTKYDSRWNYHNAYNICTAAIKRFPTSIGAANCQMLINKIKEKTLNLRMEAINPINKAILAELTYRNVDVIHCKLLPLPKDYYQQKASLNEDDRYEKRDSLWDAYIAGIKDKQAKTWKVSAPNSGDFKSHRIEIDIPKQKAGAYLLLISENENFRLQDNGLIYAFFQVSDLAFIGRGRYSKKNFDEFFIVDRNNGAPIEGAKVTFLKKNWESYASEVSEANGNITTENHLEHSKYSIRIEKGSDHLFLDGTQLYFDDNSRDIKGQKTSFFTDKSIYRPGQTLHFKGILTEAQFDGSHRPLVNQKTVVRFYDVNRQLIDKVSVTSNQFGAYSGSFTIPSSGLLGRMYLQDSLTNSQQYVYVEEYKKPTFKFNLSTQLKQGKKVDTDTLYFLGKAQTFSEMPLAGAQVQYVIYRAYEEVPTYSNRGYRYAIALKKDTLKVGKTFVNQNGRFYIEMPILQEQDTTVKGNDYTIEADLVDLTGETHSETATIYRSNQNYLPWLTQKQQKAALENVFVRFSAHSSPTIKRADKSQLLHLSAKAEKGDGTSTAELLSGSILIERYETPKQAFVTRFWSFPDTSTWDETEFRSKFPYYTYTNGEEQFNNWKRDTVHQETFDHLSEKTVFLDTKTWTEGKYKVIVQAKDSYGHSHHYKQIIRVGDNFLKADYNQQIQLFPSHLGSHSNRAPGDTVYLKVGSYFEDAAILLELENYRRVDEYRWLKPNQYQEVPIVIKEKHRGNLHYRLLSVYNNRFAEKEGNVYVGWANKDLDIEYVTFRDKIEPGSKESWTIRISDPSGKAVSSEVLASMYDAALDELKSHSWSFDLYQQPYRHSLNDWNSNYSIKERNFGVQYAPTWQPKALDKQYADYPAIGNPKSFLEFNRFWYVHSLNSGDADNDGIPDTKDLEPFSPPGYPVDTYGVAQIPKPIMAADQAHYTRVATGMEGAESAKSLAKAAESPMLIIGDETYDALPSPPPSPEEDFGDVKVRSDLKETAFFFPHLKTNDDGSVSIQFTMSEALSKWKFMTLAHSKDLMTKISTKQLITQKQLMVMPSTPRFLRQGDVVELTSKISNLSKEDLAGKVTLQLFESGTENSIDLAFSNKDAIKDFNLKQGEVKLTTWTIHIPEDWTAPVMYRFIAKAGNFSDGEQNNLPVISNKVLITEAMPILSHGKSQQNYTFNSLKTNSSSTLKHHKLTLELSPNPAWDAVLSLPYLMEYPYECSEQLFSRFYANSLASNIVNSNPKIKTVFDTWKSSSIENSSLDELMANPSLKSAILEETPWVMAAQSDQAKRKHIGTLFDMNSMAKEFAKVEEKLVKRQGEDGGFAWFSGGYTSSYITQYIVGGLGKLEALGANPLQSNKSQKMLEKALKYMDRQFVASHQSLRRQYANSSARKKDKDQIILDDNLSRFSIQYLYAKSYFWDSEQINKDTILQPVLSFYNKQATLHWRNKSIYEQGMLALAFHRINPKSTLAQVICDSLKSQAIIDKDKGMYWKQRWGYYWYQLPIETQAMMIELFSEVAKDDEVVYALKLWLLQQKKGAAWSSTKSTTMACYALLKTGGDWLSEGEEIEIKIGGKKVDQSTLAKEAGTGHFQKSWDTKDIRASMADIQLDNPNPSPAFGAVYWQYFEQHDQVKSFKDTPLKIKKTLFLETKTKEGNQLTAIKKVDLKPGDLIKVRIEIEATADMEFVHMKDMRAAGFEPMNVLSSYKYQNGLGYYEMTKDASTNFFFSALRKGKYVFEYPLRVNHKGDFSNGITTIQSMYAPEFTSHSEGIRVKVN